MFNLEGITYMFEASREFYLWCSIDIAVYEITSPANLDEILEVMRVKGDEALKLIRIM